MKGLMARDWARAYFGYCRHCGRLRTPQAENTPCPAKAVQK